MTRNLQGESHNSNLILCFLTLYSLLMHLEVPAKHQKYTAFVVINWIWVPNHHCLQRLWGTKQFFSCIHIWLCQACRKKKDDACLIVHLLKMASGFCAALEVCQIPECVCHTLSKLVLPIVASCALLLMRHTRPSAWERRYSLFNCGGGQSGN